MVLLAGALPAVPLTRPFDMEDDDEAGTMPLTVGDVELPIGECSAPFILAIDNRALALDSGDVVAVAVTGPDCGE